MIALEAPRLAGAGAALIAYAVLCARAWAAHRRSSLAAGDESGVAVLVGFASQTGFAQSLAEEAARAIEAAGVSVRVQALDAITSDGLAACAHALFIVSTCGEGNAPDNAARFADSEMAASRALPDLRYGVLALGDRSYTRYCAFGRNLDQWLSGCGAKPLFPRIDLNGADADALEAWRHHVAQLAGLAEPCRAADAPLQDWRLRTSRCINPGSAGAALHLVELEAVHRSERGIDATALPPWQSGDLLEIRPHSDVATPRLYSIASLPDDGHVQLLVRSVRTADGSPGRMSGLLNAPDAAGRIFTARIRAHLNFRLGSNVARPLILIGNGTGLAGLIAHLRHRARQGDGRNWLIFGERNAAQDNHFGPELDAFERAGLLARCDRVFSRDHATPGEYVQHRLARASATLREWVAGGAAIYVCGSATGMGHGVHQTLIDLLGVDTVARLRHEGRYRRDIY